MAKGKYLAFLDDDSYPSKDWLKNSFEQLNSHKNIAAVCGPCLTPPQDNNFQCASGLVWSSFLGSGGAGKYRNCISKKRFVDDFPSVNLIVKKSDFKKIKGFNTHHWPGEDTILCSDLVYKLNKKILYHPSIIVYHHRRKVFLEHLKQITRYALHRGNFARIHSKTSLRIGYILPSVFLIYIVFLPLTFFSFHVFWSIIPLFIYLFLLLSTFLKFIFKKNNFFISLLAIITIPLTHLYYGFLFLVGFLIPELNFEPHTIKNNQYVGG